MLRCEEDVVQRMVPEECEEENVGFRDCGGSLWVTGDEGVC